MGRNTVEGVVHDQIMNPARLPKDDPVYMPPKIVTGDKAKNVAAYVAQVAAAGGKDTGRLAEAVKSPSSNKPVAAKNGVLDMPADPNGQLAYVSKQATAPAGQLEIDSKNDANIPHDIAIEGNGVNEKGEEVTDGGDVQDLGRPEARHLHVLLHPPRPPRGRHGGQAHRQVTVALVAGCDARRRPRHRGRPRGGRCDGVRHRPHDARAPVGVRPARDDRGDRGARHGGGRDRHRGADRPPRAGAGRRARRAHRRRAGCVSTSS